MSTRTREIKFFKWHDPLQELVDDFSNLEDTKKYGLVGLEDDNSDEVLPDSTFGKNIKVGPMIVGPMGVIPITEGNIPSKLYNFWMGHTNFSISLQIAQQIEKTDGIEAINVYSRYRFRIAVGQMFKSESVLENIRSTLCDPVKPKSIKNEVYENTGKFLSSKYPYWALLQINGTLVPVTDDTKAGVEEKITHYQNVKNVVRSWETNQKTAST